MRLAFESVDLVKLITLPNASRHPPVRIGPEQNRRQREEESDPFSPASLLDLGHLTLSSVLSVGFVSSALPDLRPLDLD